MDSSTYLILAEKLDAEDPLAVYRKLFRIPSEKGVDKTYLLGNSLGLQPLAAEQAIEKVLTQWAEHGVEGFFRGDDPWMKKQEALSALMAPIVGAKPSEVSIQDALTINLHLLFSTFYRPDGIRRKIICEAKAFPSDQYMMQAQVERLGLTTGDTIIELSPREGEHTLRLEDIEQAIAADREELALVFLGGVNYYTGQLLDMEAITKMAHAAGALAGFDLAHAAGNVDLHLHDWGVDFAAWCNYKYLNGGPGAIASLFVHERHHGSGLRRPAGWWGNDAATRFLMEKEFRPAAGAAGWQVGTPPALLMATLDASLKIFQQAGWTAIRNKRRSLNGLLRAMLADIIRRHPGKLTCLTPEGTDASQCSLFFPTNGKEVFDILTAQGFFVDWREPGVIRMAPAPLYNTHLELFRLYQNLDIALSGMGT